MKEQFGINGYFLNEHARWPQPVAASLCLQIVNVMNNQKDFHHEHPRFLLCCLTELDRFRPLLAFDGRSARADHWGC